MRIADRPALIRGVAALALAYVIFGYLLIPVRLQGISMEPTYRDGQLDFTNRLAYLWRSPSRGDAIAIRMAGPHLVYVKRIVGLPGERVEIVMGVVNINGEPLIEPHVARKAPWNYAPVTLGADEYFVVGDNRAMRMDDHAFGRTTRDRILGKILF